MTIGRLGLTGQGARYVLAGAEGEMDGKGFTPETWRQVKVFQGRCASPHDVDTGAAVFALGDTFNGQAFEEPLPQPAIWFEEDEEFAVVIVQAEVHETQDGERLEVLGLLLPSGETKIGFVEDVEEVDAADPVWLALIDADHGLSLLDDDDDEELLDLDDEERD